MSSIHLTHQQIEQCLSEILVSPVDTGERSAAEQWLWTLLQSVAVGQPFSEQRFDDHTKQTETASLLGLLLARRNWPDSPTVAVMLDEAERNLTAWLQQQLAGPCTDWGSASCLQTFQYLLLSNTDKGLLTGLLYSLKDRYLLKGWDSGGDLTLESGTTGWLLMLLRMRELVSADQRIVPIVRDIDHYLADYIRYLHSHQLPIDSRSDSETLFPTSVGEDEWRIAETQSWSQGDLGHLLLLYEAERLFDQPQLAEWAHRLGGYLIHLRQMGRMQLSNAGLMTGTAGVSLLYRRLYQLTGQERYREEGMYWLHETIRTVQQPGRQLDYSLRTGMLGVACALNQWLGREVGLALLHL